MAPSRLAAAILTIIDATGMKSVAPAYYVVGSDVPRCGLRGGKMYPVVYWSGVATLVAWSAYSAYSAIIGL